MLYTCIVLSNKQTACRDSVSSITISSATIHVIQLFICSKYYNQLLLLQGLSTLPTVYINTVRNCARGGGWDT